MLGVPEDRKTNFGTYRLKDNARKWWDTTKIIQFSQLEVIPWMIFGEHSWITTSSVALQKQEEDGVPGTRAGGMSLIDYTTKFQNLERYCFRLFDTDQERADKYINGLQGGLRSRVITSMPQTFQAAVAASSKINEIGRDLKVIIAKRPVVVGGNNKRTLPRWPELTTTFL